MGALLALHSLAEKIFDCIYVFGDNLEVIDDFQVVTKKINSLLQLKEEHKGNDLYNLDGKIIFSNVSIYVASKVILRNVNFSIDSGE